MHPGRPGVWAATRIDAPVRRWAAPRPPWEHTTTRARTTAPPASRAHPKHLVSAVGLLAHGHAHALAPQWAAGAEARSRGCQVETARVAGTGTVQRKPPLSRASLAPMDSARTSRSNPSWWSWCRYLPHRRSRVRSSSTRIPDASCTQCLRHICAAHLPSRLCRDVHVEQEALLMLARAQARAGNIQAAEATADRMTDERLKARALLMLAPFRWPSVTPR